MGTGASATVITLCIIVTVFIIWRLGQRVQEWIQANLYPESAVVLPGIPQDNSLMWIGAVVLAVVASYLIGAFSGIEEGVAIGLVSFGFLGLLTSFNPGGDVK